MAPALTLDPTAGAPQLARRFVAAELGGADYDDVRDVAELLVSELVTNAVVHAASAVEVTILHDDNGTTVQVRDADTGPLVMRAGGGSELDEGGRGFLLVDRLAESWGTEHRGGRKSVWFRLRRNGAASAAPADPPKIALAEASGMARATERRLRSLLLRPEMQRAMSFDQHVREVLERVVDGIEGVGGDVTLTSASEPVARCGAGAAAHTHARDLVVEDRRLGALTVHSEHELDDDSACFLDLAAERIALLAAEHGVTKTEQQREAELDYLAEATELLSGSMNVALTLTLATQIVVPRLADWCAAYVVDERGRPRRVTATHRREDRIDAVHELLDRDREVAEAISRSAVTGSPQRLPSTTPLGGQRNHVSVVPLVSRSRALGVMALGRTTPLDAVTFMATLELGRRTALAVDNARLHEEQVAAANALQASLLPSGLPELPGIEFAARYHSASPGLSVGGDFYDAFQLLDGSVVLAIGDVCGKGAEAAAVTGTTRDVLRLLLLDGRDLTDALRRLNRALLDHPSSSRFCTVALARIERDGDDVIARLSLAGHPEPVLLHADGSTEFVGTPGDLLGVLQDQTMSLTETAVMLAPGDSLVLYTDGVTERRDGLRMFGQWGLRTALSSVAGADADTIVERVEHAARSFVDTELRDDLAILVIRRPPG